jgi:hypothetical protein
MAELKRKDEELTTADLAGRNTETERRPQLVRNESIDTERITQDRADLNDEPGFATQSGNVAENRIENAAQRNEARIDRTANVENTNATNQPAAALFSESEVGDFRNRWSNIQTGFVDEPRRAVEDADNLVASLMKKMAEGFANERSRLEKQWDRGDNVSTEDLRVALQRYRSFFDRLLKA